VFIYVPIIVASIYKITKRDTLFGEWMKDILRWLVKKGVFIERFVNMEMLVMKPLQIIRIQRLLILIIVDQILLQLEPLKEIIYGIIKLEGVYLNNSIEHGRNR
tara:strand:+ start:8661 stop:8972 length:312 start_codon:yes stop_codon:yes gene_type:complete